MATKQGEFRQPITQALCELGGSATRAQVLSLVEGKLIHRLTPDDYRPYSGGELVWRKRASWEKFVMKQDGLIRKDSPLGRWELTEDGFRLCEHSPESHKNRTRAESTAHSNRKNLTAAHSFESFEIIDSKSPDIFGLKIRSADGQTHTWWMRDTDLARMHHRIHWTLNLSNKQLDEMARTGPSYC